MSNIDRVRQFIDRINAHDVQGLTALMTDDHIFVDSIGSSVQGRREMERAWTGYFRLFPDYRIQAHDLFEDGDRVAIFGTASATYSPSGHLFPDHHWEVPAAWKAEMRGDLIARWSVFSDNYKTVQMIKGIEPQKKEAPQPK